MDGWSREAGHVDSSLIDSPYLFLQSQSHTLQHNNYYGGYLLETSVLTSPSFSFHVLGLVVFNCLPVLFLSSTVPLHTS